jgi:CHAT domain-containing protein
MNARLRQFSILFLCAWILTLSLLLFTPAPPLLSQGMTAESLYQSGEIEKALTSWESSLKTAQESRNKLEVSRLLSNLALGYQQLNQWSKAETLAVSSVEILESLPPSLERSRGLAQALNNQGLLKFNRGQPESALEVWQAAAIYYRQAEDTSGKLLNEINQVKALQSLGLNRQACELLTQGLHLSSLDCRIGKRETQTVLKEQQLILEQALGASTLPIETHYLLAWQSLGQLLGNLGQVKLSRWLLENLLEVVSEPQQRAKIFFYLARLAQKQNDFSSSLSRYQEAEENNKNSSLMIQIQLAKLRIYLDTDQLEEVNKSSNYLQTYLEKLPTNQAQVYAIINYVQSFLTYQSFAPPWQELAKLSQVALQKSRYLNSRRGESYSLGTLGAIYEVTQQISIAYDLTQQALVIAQEINAPEILYRWQWQLGRLLKAQGKREQAIALYQEAIKSTQLIQADLASSNQDIQFSFQDSIEPIYRELVALILQHNPGESVSQEQLRQVPQIMESLQVAELNNFFQQACLSLENQENKKVNNLDPEAAIVYPIILKDRLEIIVTFADGSIQNYTSQVTAQELEKILKDLRFNLVIRSRRDFFPPAQAVYTWLIKPLERDLQAHQVKTLIFGLEGAFRNVPLAALYDGQKYLIENYAIALTPSLQLLAPDPLSRTNLNTLAAGLTQGSENFAPLSYVQRELQTIAQTLPTKKLLDKDFTVANLENNITGQDFPIVHVATHGQFSSNFEDTFILIWNNLLNIEQLEQLLRGQNIELFVLSACETARGDRRAVLGLAGIAVRSGAKSTLATLWSINDEANAEFMGYFYRALASKEMTRAQALQTAQLQLLGQNKYLHPFYWSVYVLLGNWL